VIILPLPTWESISLHSSFHLAYCILIIVVHSRKRIYIQSTGWERKGGTVAVKRKGGSPIDLLRSLIWSLSSKVLPGSKQPSKNSQTSPLIAGCTPWHIFFYFLGRD
jgi:hypothetical protein